MDHWQKILINPDTTIFAAIASIDAAGLRAAMVVDDNNRLLGMVTDGDIRRAILKNVNFDKPITCIMNKEPVTATSAESKQQLLARLKSLSLVHIPIVNTNQQVIGFETIESLLSSKKSNCVVVMAGGAGKRLYPLTLDCPKPLLPVGNTPILELLLKKITEHGFHQFYFSVNYKADMIKSYFADGSKWGVNIAYLEESEALGTAGALSLLPCKPSEAIIVINADVVTTVDFKSLLDFHQHAQVTATLCIREHKQIVPYGVVERHATTHHLLTIVEKPVRQFYFNAGIYVLEPVLLNLLQAHRYCDMPDLLTRAVHDGHVIATFPIHEYWLDVGRHEDYAKAHDDYAKIFA